MAAKDLITLARAKQAILAITDSTYDTLLATLITAVSDAVEKYCRRDFYARSYDELYSGNGDRRLLLREYPIQSIQSVRYRPVTALKIINNNQGLNQQARVTVTSAGLTLVAVASGVSSSTTVAFSGNATLQALATAINALGSGWSAQVVGDSGGDYGLWPSADLYVPPSYGDGATSQGALTARGQFAELKLHTYELAGYQFDPRGWLLRAIPYTDPELLHPEDLVWPVGINNFRVQYTAGFTTIPESIQEALARWVAICWKLAQRDPNLLSQNISQSVHQTWDRTDADHQPPRPVRALLACFRRHTVHTNQGWAMSLPMPANNTCDIYRTGHAPPSSPDVSGVRCYLMPYGQSSLTTPEYTHILYIDATVDIRDNFIASTFSAGGNADMVYIPDHTGTPFQVVLVRRYGQGTASDHKRVLLARQAPTWPTNNV